MTAELGLRERKKLATRRALGGAALQLAISDGIEGLTPERIADACDVSPRTFRNYFSSAEEAIISGLQAGAFDIADTLRARPADEPIWDSLCIALVTTIERAMPARELMRLLGLIRCNRGLMVEHLTVFEDERQQIAEIIAERTGTDVVHDVYPRLLANTAGMAVKTAMDLWSQGDTGRSFAEILTEAMGLLSRGLPIPTTAAAVKRSM